MKSTLLLVLFCLIGTTAAFAQSATQSVTIIVEPASSLGLSGRVQLDDSATTKGEVSGSSSYSLSSTEPTKISAALQSGGPALTLAMDSPAGGQGLGATELDRTSRSQATGIPASQKYLKMVYRTALKADSAQLDELEQTRVVLLTLTN
ncbi:MAG: hypothetical protein ACI80V_001208 [Rhodothermales bacterium]